MNIFRICCFYIIAILINSITYVTQCEEYKSEFCDENYVDLVCFDELFDYKIIRDKWVAEDDKESGRVEEFKL
jgi:hypothetical protein